MNRARTRRSNRQWTSRQVLICVGAVASLASAVYWYGVMTSLTDDRLMAVAFTAIVVLAPPALWQFIIPWSPAGMLLQKINARTWGSLVVLAAASYLLYYSVEIQYSWWAAQPVTIDSNLVWQQVIVGVIGFVFIPALLFTPVSSQEFAAQVEQAHLVERYEIQVAADIQILRSTMMRGRQLALLGLSNLTDAEREELNMIQRGLVVSIDRTLQEITTSVERVSGVPVPYQSLRENDTIQHLLDTIEDVIVYDESPTARAQPADDESIIAQRLRLRDERQSLARRPPERRR